MKKLLRWLLLIWCLVAHIPDASADKTNIWPFTTASQYDVSNTNYIEVADGVAKLKLQAATVGDFDLNQYLESSVIRDSLVAGPDVLLSLKTLPGGTYVGSGEFISRVFDGGQGTGNRWDYLQVLGYNTVLANASGELSPAFSNIVLLAHMNNDNWLNAVTAVPGIASPTGTGGPTFSTKSKLGSHCGLFNGQNYLTYSGSYSNVNKAFTAAFWLNCSNYKGSGVIPLVVTLYTSSGVAGYMKLGSDQPYFNFFLSANFGWRAGMETANSAQGTFGPGDENQWHHIAMTYDDSLAVGSRISFYKDGELLPKASDNCSEALGVVNRIDVCGAGGVGVIGLFDEVSIFNKALKASEIKTMYLMPRSLLIQCKTADALGDLTNKSFVGPDGTTATYFGAGLTAFSNTGPFDRLSQFLQYKVFLIGQNDGLLSPTIDSLGVIGSRVSAYDNVLGDFSQSAESNTVLVVPAPPPTIGVGLNKPVNGGYSSSGTYVSRIFDAGASVYWDSLRWDRSQEIDLTEAYLLGLWHMDGGWSDASGHGYNGNNISNISYSANAKLGSQSAVFNGASASVDLALGTNAVGTVEFWINSPNASGGILDFGKGRTIWFSQRLVKATGFTGIVPEIIVNGQENTTFLHSGWNHVAVIFAPVVGPEPLALSVGRAGNAFLLGMLDDLAVYKSAKDAGSIKRHYLMGGGSSAGSLRFQVRGSDFLPIPANINFVGPGNSVSAYYTANAGSALPSDVWRKRYFQYKLLLDGDGSASPLVYSVHMDYSGPSTGTTGDESAANFVEGTFVNGSSRLLGAELTTADLAFVPGLVNLDAVSAVSLEGLWHMDEITWPPGSSVKDSSSFNRNGDPQNGATPVTASRVGVMAGSFNGVNQYLILPSISLADHFTVQGWFRLTSSARSAVLSRDDGRFVLEVNGDGSSTVTGAVTLVVKDAVTRKVGAALNAGVNDGRWHHLAGVRDGASAFLYLDGIRVASTFLDAMTAPGLGQISVARHGETAVCMGGYVDEVSIYSRALSDAEILAGIAYGPGITSQGHYVSKVIDAGGPAIWENLAWEENAPYGDALSDLGGFVGLWHMDQLQGSTVPDSSASGNDGQTQGSVALGAGKFSQALSLNGAGGVTIPFAGAPEQSAFTVEAWVKLDQANNRIIFSRRNVADGYELATDINGMPYLAVGAVTCTGLTGIRPGVWTHLAGTFDGSYAALFEDGICIALAPVTSAGTLPANGYIGISSGGTRGVAGLIDEVGVHSAALNSEEIMDRARAGVGGLRFQGRAGDDPSLLGIPFVGSDGTSGSFFDVADGSTMLGTVPLGRYFQYQAFLTPGNGRLAPSLFGVRIKQSRYPSDNPWVSPKIGAGATFLAKLLTFSHILTQNTDANVRYQITGDSTNWFWWNSSAASWENVTGQGYGFASSISEINANVPSFAKLFYDKTGGELRFRAYLHSQGNDQVAIDEVKSIFSEGRITVLAPNGAETNKNALLTGVPFTIRWASTGKVSNQLKIEYSRDGGLTWPTLVASNVVNSTNGYSWVFPAAITDEGMIRITDMQDATVSDTSDSAFQLVQRFRVLAPNGGEYWLTGTNNTIRWASAIYLGNKAKISYAADGVNFNYLISPPIVGTANIEGSVSNTFAWVPPADDPTLPSETGRIRVETPGGSGSDDSDEVFILAGLAFSNPNASSYVNRGGLMNIAWTSAGAGTNVAFDYSDNNGASWTNILVSVPNKAGANVYPWTVAVTPSDNARMRCRSLSGNTNLVGLSQKFIVADVQVKAPDASSVWQAGSTNTIVWIAGGVGNLVNLYYSTNSGAVGAWIPISGGYHYANVSGSNTFNWTVPPYPGDKVQVKVEAVIDTNNLWSASPDFRIAGVRILTPNGGELWNMGADSPIKWTYESAGSDATIYFAYDGLTFETFPGGQRGLIDRQTSFTPITPTSHAKVKIVANNPAPFSDMYDISDDYFIVGGIKVTSPTNSAMFTVGTSGNRITWTSAGALETGGDGFASIYYTTDSGVTSNFIARVGNNENYPGGNSYLWNMAADVIPSDRARIMVRSGAYKGFSEEFLLRGIKLTAPVVGSVVDLGTTTPINWLYAGVDSSAKGYFYLSTDGGVTFPALVPANALNSVQGAWSINANPFNWLVPMTTTPSTNAVIKFAISESATPGDVGYSVNSPVFTLRGLKIMAPNASSQWAHDSTNLVQVAGAVAGPYFSLYYSPNGIAYDFARPVAVNATLNTGMNTYSWGVERTRVPSSNATLMVMSALATNVSEPFGVKGVLVTSPQNTSIWAVGDSNTVSWVAYGTVGSYTVELIKPGNIVIPIASGVSGNSVGWSVPSGSEGSNVFIRVRDSGGYYGDSGLFRIVAEPTVVVVSPAAGDLWNVSDTYQIQWARGGQMSNNFTVSYSTSPFTTTNVIFNGVAAYDPVLNLFSTPWTVPDSLGITHIMVQNNIRSDVQGQQDNLRIVGKFTLIYPNGGQTNIYALKPETVSWYTMGSVNSVNLYYSTDPLHGTGSWVRINSSPIGNPGRGTEPSSYSWTPPSLQSETVRLRVEQLNEPGAYDDSDRDFAIRYYQIIWHVYDEATSNNLDQLSVSDSSGWSEGNLSSPVVHYYPYGLFDTVWAREYFFNNVTLKWPAEPSRIINVSMKRSDVEPDYTVYANFVYDPTNAQFRVNSWLQRRGQVVPKPSKCTISVYDATGALVPPQLVSTQPDANGIFWQTLMNTLERGKVYFAKVEIEFSAVVYSSGLTFNLRVPTDGEQMQQMLDVINRIDTNLIDLATAEAIFRGTAGSKLDSLTNSAEVIKSGLTNLAGKVDLLSTQTLAQLSVLTNTIGVIGPGETNLLDLVKNLPSNISSGQREPRILTRPTTVKYGSSVNLLYRTLVGLTASYRVMPVGGAQVDSGAMGGGVGGIYEANLTANWGYGDYQIECADSAGSSDKMILKVARMELDDLALTMGDVSGQLARVEFTLTNLNVTVSNIYGLVEGTATNIFAVIDVVDQLAQLTNLNVQVSVMTNAIGQIVGMTNFSSQLNYMTNIMSQLTPLTNLAPQMATMADTMAQLAPMTNFGPQLNYVTNIVGKLTGITNIASQVAQLTNMSAQVASLTNLPAQMDGVVAAINQLGSLTNLGPQVDQLGGIIGQITSLTNLAPKVDQMSASLDQLIVLTNMPSQMNGVVTAISQLGGLTNLGGQVDQLVTAMGQIAGLTNISAQMNGVVAAVNQLGSLTNLGGQVDQLVGAMGQIAGLTNMAAQMNGVVAAVNQLGGLTNLGGQVDALVGAMGQISGLTNMAGQVNTITMTLNGMTNLNSKVDRLTTSMGQVTNMVGTLNTVATSVAQLAGLTNLGSSVAALNSAIGQIVVLTNLSGKVDNMALSLNAMTNLSAKVDQLSGTVGLIGTLTNLPSQMSALQVAMGQLGGLTNLGPQVDALTGVIGQIMALTNMSGQVNGLATGVSGLQTTVAVMSNTLASLNAAFQASLTASNNATSTAAVGASLTSLSTTYSNMYTMIEEGLGTANDSPTASTVFGKIAAIEENVTAVGGKASAAASRASGARSQANSAAGAAQRIKKNMASSGQMETVMTDVGVIRKSLEDALISLKGITGDLTTEEMSKQLKEARTTLQKTAEGRGGAPAVKESVEAKEGVKIEAGSLSDPKAVESLINQLSETKAMMQATRQLMDEAVNKPVVVDWLEGSK